MKMVNIKTSIIAGLLIIVTAAMLLNSCEKEEKSDKIILNSYGPSPNIRGGQLFFIGENLDKVTSVNFPDSINGQVNEIAISTFISKGPKSFTVTIPEEADNGYITLKTPQGDITTKTLFVIVEPILIDSVYPSSVKPGNIFTIEGLFLDLVEEVIFNKDIVVTGFESQDAGKITVIVPEEAQTGTITLSNGADEPLLTISNEQVVITLPSISGISPNPVKAGNNLTITGADLDLVKQIEFGGEKISESFVSQNASQIVVTVPVDAKDGKFIIRPASGVDVESSQLLELVIPTITAFTPDSSKTGSVITVQGTNLDVITKVIFGGGEEGIIQAGGSATQIQVEIPPTATSDILIFVTAAEKEVKTTKILGLYNPKITSVSPLTVQTKDNITITGTNLDVVGGVRFPDSLIAPVLSGNETSIVIKVPSGAQSGRIVIVSTNGFEMESLDSLTISASNAPVISTVPDSCIIGEKITLTGTGMDMDMDVEFPGGILASKFGIKNATTLEVYVPSGIMLGEGVIRLITWENEIADSPIIKFKE